MAGGNPGRGSAAGSARPPRGRLPHPGTALTDAAGQKGNRVLSPDFQNLLRSPGIDFKEPIPPEPVFVKLLCSPGIDSQPGGPVQ